MLNDRRGLPAMSCRFLPVTGPAVRYYIEAPPYWRYIMRSGRTTAVAVGVLALGVLVGSDTAQGQTPSKTEEVLPRPEPPFKGKIGRTVKESTPDFPKEVQAPAGAPNVLLILTDDVGFGASTP